MELQMKSKEDPQTLSQVKKKLQLKALKNKTELIKLQDHEDVVKKMPSFSQKNIDKFIKISSSF